MAVFLRDTGIRDQAGLRTYTDNDQRNTLITENGRTGRQDLQALRNAPNVRTRSGLVRPARPAPGFPGPHRRRGAGDHQRGVRADGLRRHLGQGSASG